MSNTYLFLTGGLGNQLFQVAGGLSRENSTVVLDCNLGNPRTNKLGKPDIWDFQLPANVILGSEYKKNRFFSKISGYLLREGMEPTKFEQFLGVGRIVSFVFGKLLYFRYENQIRVIQAKNNGFFKIDRSTQNEYLIGYFQSYQWPNIHIVDSQLQSIYLTNPSPDLTAFTREIRDIQTVMVHVRLGDYKDHANFGIPSIEYYELALNRIAMLTVIEKILLFSNEPTLARAYIPTHLQELIQLVPDFGGSSAETLEAMRHAKNYVIGNSSLSWWGAKLSYTQGATIIAPKPWFKKSSEPADLIPPEWIRIDGFHQ
jgi:hypothetical protein